MIRVFEPNIGPAERAAIDRTLRDRRVGPGERVAEFESLLCAETGAKHAVCCNSGTTALMLAIRALTMGNDGIVAFPSYTFLAGANAANLCHKTVRLQPIGDSLLYERPRQITERVGLHIFVSHNAQCGSWENFRDVPALHDAAQSLGVLRLTGNDTATVSFSGPKLLTTGQGGAVLTNVEAVADACRRFADHGGGTWRQTRIHEKVGGNFRMADLNAALGIAQMHRLPELLAIRQERFAWYREFFPQMPEDGWCALVRTAKATECIKALADAGYEALQPYRPVQESRLFRYQPVDENAVSAANELLYLPVHYKASRDDVRGICETILKVSVCARGN